MTPPTPLEIAAMELLASIEIDSGVAWVIATERDNAIKKIAAFASSQIQKAVEEEREACARVADREGAKDWPTSPTARTAATIAAALRSRGEKGVGG